MDAVIAEPVIERKAAISRQIVEDVKPNQKDPDPPQADNLGVLQGSRAELLDSTSLEKAGEPKDGDEPALEPADKPILGKFKTAEDLAASYTELERKLTQLATEKADLERKVASPPVVVEEPVVLDENIGDLFLTEPKAALEKVTKAVTANIKKNLSADETAKQNKARAEKTESDQKEVVDWFAKDHPGLVDEGELRVIDAIAYAAPGKTLLEKYQSATDTYLKAKEAQEAAANVNTDREAMVKSAAQPTSKKLTSPNVKVWRQSDIDNMILRDPAAYDRNSEAIAKAYKEGRVRRDL
jgi:hypothetical protein